MPDNKSNFLVPKRKTDLEDVFFVTVLSPHEKTLFCSIASCNLKMFTFCLKILISQSVRCFIAILAKNVVLVLYFSYIIFLKHVFIVARNFKNI